MNHVTDLNDAGRDASVLTDAGSGGLIGRAVLADAPLVDQLAEDETVRYVLRNKKHGVTVEGPDGTEEYAPDRRHSGAAVVTDTRVLFAVGHGDGDQFVSVSLPDVVDVRTEDGLIGGAFVVETVEDERYRFPCRGDLEPVREYLDAAVGVWTRAERQVEQARERVERLQSAFESGNADVVLAAVGDVEETLADAREAADALDGARRAIEVEATEVREELAAVERRAHAESAEQARERAHVRWDDQEYEAAFDDLDEADGAYAAARAIDADEPPDDLLAERRETLADERDRLAGAPVERADHAADVAAATDDPGGAVDWWETAVERYETALSLDWGRDDRRFGGDPEGMREDLADAARELVAAYCDLAREHIEDGDGDREDNPDAAAVAYELAAEALAKAREVATERVPDVLDEVEAVESALEDRREDLPDVEAQVGTEVDGGRTETSQSDAAGPVDVDGSEAPDTTEGPEVTDTTEGPEVTDDHERPTDDGDADVGGTDGATDTDRGVDAEDEVFETEATDAESSEVAGPATESSEAEPDDADPAGSPREVTDTQTIIGSPDVGDPETDGEDVEYITDPTAVGADALPSLIARIFESAGWSTAVFGASTARQYDLLAGTDGPVGVTVCVWTVHPAAVERVDVPAVERFAAYFGRAEEADAGAICTAAPISEPARSRADEEGLKVLDGDDLAERLDALSIPAEEF